MRKAGRHGNRQHDARTKRVGAASARVARLTCGYRGVLAPLVLGGWRSHSLHLTEHGLAEERGSPWPFARPVSRGLARGGAAAGRTPRPLRRPRTRPPDVAGCRLAAQRSQKPPESLAICFRLLVNFGGTYIM